MFAIGKQPTIRLSHVKQLSRHKPSACMRLTKYQYKRLQADIGGLTTLYAIIKAEKNKEKEPKPRVRFRFLLAERTGFEPAVVLPTHAFQACALNRSTISPNALYAKPICLALIFYSICKKKSTIFRVNLYFFIAICF